MIQSPNSSLLLRVFRDMLEKDRMICLRDKDGCLYCQSMKEQLLSIVKTRVRFGHKLIKI